MSISVRTLSVEDTAAVNKLSEQLGYPHAIAETAERIQYLLNREDHCLLVATEGAVVIGWVHACAMMWLESGSFVEITGLVVDESYRGKRAGELMVNAIKEWCRSRGCNRIKVRSNTKRIHAHRFYSKAGFTEVKESKVFELEL